VISGGRRLPATDTDPRHLAVAVVVAAAATLVTERIGVGSVLAATVAAIAFAMLVAGFYRLPHVTVALVIPLFARLPITEPSWVRWRLG
jgi:hypothetical protein